MSNSKFRPFQPFHPFKLLHAFPLHNQFHILHPFYLRIRVAAVFLSTTCFFCAADSAQPFQFALSQTLESTGAYDAAMALDSSPLDCRMQFAVPDITKPDADARTAQPETWAIRLNALQGLSLHTGALTFSGLPARARNPLFSLTSPFYTPTKPETGPTLGLGSSKKTDNAAVEYRKPTLNLAACTSSFDNPSENGWILLSGNFQSFSESDTYLAISLFSGTRSLVRKQETSWYVNEPEHPGTALLMPGAECLFRRRAIGGSLTGLMNMRNYRKPDGLIRSELFVETGPLLVTGGFFQRGRQVLDYDGTEGTTLSRSFIAPQLNFDTLWHGHSSITLGAIAWVDKNRGDKYYAENETTCSGGGGFILDTPQTKFRMQGIQHEEIVTLTTAVYQKQLLFRGVSGSVSGKCLIPEGSTFEHITEMAVSANLGVNPFVGRENGLKANLGYDGKFKPKTNIYCSEGELSIEGFFSTRHTDWKCEVSLKIRNDGSPQEGTITIKTNLQ